MSEVCQTVMDSPVGRLLLRAEDEVLTLIEFQRGGARKREDPAGAARRKPLREVIRQLEAYFRGDLEEFDLIFAYPWPGEEDIILSLFERHAARGSVLLSYHGMEGVRAHRAASS